MPSVVETEEILTEILERPTYKTPQAATTPRHDESTDEPRDSQRAWEKPLDLLVRKNPYIYADALFG